VKELTEEDDFTLPMTPLIDIVFQLLIFFLLATTVKEEELDLQIRLAAGDQGAPRGTAAGAILNIGVRKDGTVTLSGQEIEIGDLEKRLKEVGLAREKPKVFVRGDRDAPYGKVAQVYQMCVRCNLSDVIVPYVFESAPAP
jgi:biopolymer transport protein ExbD